MLQRLRERMGRDEGFTLIELLVVMLILGVLAAIAIPSFINQREKAQDSDAKAGARTIQTAIETRATDNGGSFAGSTFANLDAIEPTLEAPPGPPFPVVSVVASAVDSYTVRGTSQTGRNFDVVRTATGQYQFPCAPVGGGCDGDWSN